MGIGCGKGLKSLKASRKNGNMQPQEVGGWAVPPECTRDLGGERHSGLKERGTLVEMPFIGEAELAEFTSSRKTEHQVRDGVAMPQSKL